MVDAAGQRWPDGWVKGAGLRPPAGTDPSKASPPFVDIGEEYVRQIVDLSLKTKANYHGLIHGVFAYAVKRGYLVANPALGTAPKQSRVKQSRPERRFSPSESWRPPCGSREPTATC